MTILECDVKNLLKDPSDMSEKNIDKKYGPNCAASVKILLKDPSNITKKYFDKAYGDGSAASVLKSAQINIGDLFLPYKTKPYKKNWSQVEGVPCKVLEKTSTEITLNSFHSSSNNTKFLVNIQDFYREFTKLEIKDDNILNLDKYPTIKTLTQLDYEFERRQDVTDLISKVKIKSKEFPCVIKKVLDDKLAQIVSPAGNNKVITLEDFNKFNNEKKDTHKRYGDPIFNRTTRWAPSIDCTYEDFEKSLSFPAPLGIRPHDFALPSELVKTAEELINQIINFDGIDEKDFNTIAKVLPFIKKNPHKCKYCNKPLNIKEYSSEYKSKNNYTEICHRDPNGKFSPDNMYWGHGNCNRIQGGFSEKEREKDGLRLILQNENLTEEEKQILMNIYERL